MHNLLLSEKWVKTGIKKDKTNFLELSENKNTMYTNLWNKMNAFTRWNFLAQDVNKKKGRKEGKLEEIYIANFIIYLRVLEMKGRKKEKKERRNKKERNPKRRYEEITTWGAKFNKVETNKQMRSNAKDQWSKE